MAEGAAIIGGGVCAFVLVLIILLMCSLQGLHATTFALKKNNINGKIDFEHVFYGGRNFIGFWNHYVEFPATIQSLEWLTQHPTNPDRTKDLSPMLMRTADGLMVQLGIIVQYKIVQDMIPEMYREFEDSYENFFISNIRSGFQDILAGHQSDDLWVHRHELANQFQQECNTICADPTKIRGFIECWGVQLTGAHIDTAIEEKIIERQVQVQQQEYYRTRQTAALIRAGTEVLESSYDRNITIARALASSEAYRIRNAAMTNATYNYSIAKATALRTIHDLVAAAGPLGALDIIKYQERTALIERTEASMAYGEFASVRLSIHPPATAAAGPAAGHRRLDSDLPNFDDFGTEPMELQPPQLFSAGRREL